MRTASVLASLPLALAGSAKRAQPAPLLVPRASNLVADKYIVKLYDNAEMSALDATLSQFQASADHSWTKVFKGFATTLDAEALSTLQNHAQVEYIEQDSIVTINEYVTEEDATWGISRISHRDSIDGYVYDSSAGEGTCAYIIDTGIEVDHEEFEGRATWLANFADNDDTDGNGHGTHVAGTVGSATYGVAKNTNLYAVKVLDSSGSGTTSGVISGMDYVTEDSATRECGNGAVANMSLGGSRSTALNAAAASMVSAGVFLAVAAGNDASDASSFSPASEESACTVGATTSADAVASYSNYGSLVDIFAPGTNVLSTWTGGSTNTISGTSMATPHITGLGAYLLALEGSRDPEALCAYIQELATEDALTGVRSGTVNLLAFNGNPDEL
ncbi:subtilisin-like protein [Xylariomycetidae sp. FL2044]|nr:subtilisin-like protein [Xylariomycetidae sp. FL2044]